MSLRVWLPLTKDLRNQGLSDVTVTNNGATFNSAGKLGGCYNFTNSAIGIGANNITLGTTFSITCWIKINSYNQDWANAFKIYKDGYDYIGLCMNQTSASTKQLGFHIYKNNGSNARTGVYDAYYMPLTIGTWYHLCFVVTPSEVKTYQNGVNIRTGSITTTFPSVSNYSLGLGKSSLFGGLDCSINDFRLYDHALSQMEVKQLAQGLVLHYPLNRQGWGQENLMPNSVEMPVGNSSASTGTWRLAGSSQMTRSRIAITDSPVSSSAYGFQSVGLQTGQDASCWGIDGFPRENGITYTLSAWGRIVGGSTTAAMLGFSVYSGTTLSYGGTYGPATSSESKYYGSGAYDYAGGQLNPNGSWTRIYRTFTSTATSDNIYVGFNTAKTGSDITVQVCGVKLEKGNKMTTWTPNANELLYTSMALNSTTEYDCSGFCNNGTRTGTFSWTSDTPKYSVSTNFAAVGTVTNNTIPIHLSNEFTIAWWGKVNSWKKRWEGMFLLQNSAALNADLNTYDIMSAIHASTANSMSLTICQNGSSYAFDKYKWTYTIGTWAHYTCTYKAGAISIYQNGVLVYTETITDNSSNDYYYRLGGRASACDCQMSDFRIYVTALSADDVKSLYQNSAYIDSSGNVYGAVHSEV